MPLCHLVVHLLLPSQSPHIGPEIVPVALRLLRAHAGAVEKTAEYVREYVINLHHQPPVVKITVEARDEQCSRYAPAQAAVRHGPNAGGPVPRVPHH